MTQAQVQAAIVAATEHKPEPLHRSADWPEPLAEEAFHGVAGEFVRTIEPHTEADPVALLLQFLVAFGNAVGRSAHFTAEADRHGTNLNAVFVGETAKGRKGVSWGYPQRTMVAADSDWEGRILSGLSSGEGLIWQVRDAIEKQEPIKENRRVVGYDTVIVDHGVSDKRLLVFESEFALVLRVLAREGNTLSAVIRNAWDTGDLRILTKNSPARATGAHISIIGHITRQELLRYLADTEALNGFGNRFFWACVRRSKVLPEGGNLDPAVLAPITAQISSALSFARNAGEMRRDDLAREIWRAVYPELSEGKPGLLGAMVARAEAQVMRLACIYALLDLSSAIREKHLRAALAVWEYCEASSQFIFGSNLGDPVADKILRALDVSADGMTRTQIRDLFGRNRKAAELDRALGILLESRRARHETTTTGGHPEERWFRS